MKSKYHSRRCELDGIMFDSRKEARRYAELKILERAGEIKKLERQVPFTLIPAQRDEAGKVIEREVKYVADFMYVDKDGIHVEDVKGMKTRDYIIKRKLMLWVHGIRIEEV